MRPRGGSSREPDPALRATGEELLRRAGLYEVVQHVGQLDRAVSDGHRALRRTERASVLQIEVGGADRAAAEREFALARRHAGAARGLLREQQGNETWRSLAREFESRRSSEEAQAALAEARERWQAALLEADLPHEDVTELVGTWDSASQELRERGVEAVFDRLDERLGEVDDILTEANDWGRKPHSPLEWWQWLLIAIVVGVVVATIVACLIWAGCSWIYAIFVAICAGAVAGGGVWAGVCIGILF